MIAAGNLSLFSPTAPLFTDSSSSSTTTNKVAIVKSTVHCFDSYCHRRSPLKAMRSSKPSCESPLHVDARAADSFHGGSSDGGENRQQISSATNENIVWHKCSVDKTDRQELLQQKGCVVWITGLSGSGKSTLACALNKGLHSRGKLAYVLDGDNVRHGLNSNLTFKAEDRAENIRRIGEVAKLFTDAGVICIASVISPYRKDRDASRALLSRGEFIEVFMDVPLKVCEARDPKGLYKLARAGQIKGFTGVDDPYEAPLNPEIALRQEEERCATPGEMAETVISYLEEKGYLTAESL